MLELVSGGEDAAVRRAQETALYTIKPAYVFRFAISMKDGIPFPEGGEGARLRVFDFWFISDERRPARGVTGQLLPDKYRDGGEIGVPHFVGSVGIAGKFRRKEPRVGR